MASFLLTTMLVWTVEHNKDKAMIEVWLNFVTDSLDHFRLFHLTDVTPVKKNHTVQFLLHVPSDPLGYGHVIRHR